MTVLIINTLHQMISSESALWIFSNTTALCDCPYETLVNLIMLIIYLIGPKTNKSIFQNKCILNNWILRSIFWMNTFVILLQYTFISVFQNTWHYITDLIYLNFCLLAVSIIYYNLILIDLRSIRFQNNTFSVIKEWIWMDFIIQHFQ